MLKGNKPGLCLVLALANMALAWGQSPSDAVYEGFVVSAADGNRLGSVICQTLDANKQSRGYTFSDENGFFSLRIDDDTQFVQFRLLGYATLIIPVKDTVAPQTVKLHVSDVLLQEVVVAVPPVQSNHDTLRYDVNSFRGQEDRYLSDVLKKLPGVKVSDNGTVSYLGEAISQFYIEGRDLLGGQYTVATNNLTVDAVNAVEILQNNQHIKALKGIALAEKPAMNIRLEKEYKARPFGEAQTGAGGAPLLYDGKALTAYLGENLQALVTAKGQNTGNFILDELDDKLDTGDLFSFEPLAQPAVTAPSPKDIPLPANRYLFNKTGLGSAHALIPLSQDAELKINLAGGTDHADQDFTLTQNFAVGDDFLQITERSRQKDRTDNAKASVSYEHNSDDRYLRNEAAYYYKKESTESTMNVNGEGHELISGSNSVYYVQNHFQSLFKFKDARTIHVHSFLRFEGNKDNLEKRTAPVSDISERFNTQYVVNKNQVSSSFALFDNRLDVGLYTSYRQKDVANNLQSQDLDPSLSPFQKARIKRLQVGFEPGYQIRTRKRNVYFTLKLPVAYHSYTVATSDREQREEAKIIFSPSLSNTWQINHQWETLARIGYGFDYSHDLSLLSASYFSGYRSVYIPSNAFNSDESIFAAGGIRYKDVVKMFFVNMNILYRSMKRNYVNVFYHTPEWSYHTTQNQRDRGNQFSVTSDISKVITPCKLSVTVNPSYSRTASHIIQQSIQVENADNAASLSAGAEWKGIKNMSLVYKAQGRVVWNENNLTETNPLKNLTQNIGWYYFPAKNIDFSVTSDYVIYEKGKDEYSKFFFLDFKGAYRHKSMEYGFAVNNLLNNNLFSLTELSSIDIHSQQIPLRKREFLAVIKFKF